MDAPVDRAVPRGGNREQHAVHVRIHETALLEAHRPAVGQPRDAGVDVGRDHGDPGAGPREHLDPARRDGAAAHHQAGLAVEMEGER